jgi:hypothetical protein
MYQAETGEVNEKGHENQARKIFKEMIAGDLSRASTVPMDRERETDRQTDTNTHTHTHTHTGRHGFNRSRRSGGCNRDS